MTTARYDGRADWYETWATTEGAEALAAARATLLELLPDGPGTALDIGCGTGCTRPPSASAGSRS